MTHPYFLIFKNKMTMKRNKSRGLFGLVREMIREIDNYFFFIHRIELIAENVDLRKYSLRTSKKHSIYGAVNMPPELLLCNNEKELEQMEKTYFGSEISRLNEMLIEYQLVELYCVDFERVKTDDYYAYVFDIRFAWKYCIRRNIIYVALALLSTLAVVAISSVALVRVVMPYI